MRRQPALSLALLLFLFGACSGSSSGSSGDRTTSPPAPPPAATATDGDREIEQLADDLMERAAHHEPLVSKLLVDVAARVKGTMAGFEHRLKKRESLLRKIRASLAGADGKVSDVVIDDALRYTLQVEDEPAGNHASAIRAAFSALEAAGHKVIKVKNYWPRGDNYSGVNAVLMAPDGLPWELQFHTAESFRIKNRDHELYEEMRLETTPVERRRVLFQKLAEPWEGVPIPKDMLEPKAIHQVEEIIQRSSP